MAENSEEALMDPDPYAPLPKVNLPPELEDYHMPLDAALQISLLLY